MFAANCWYYAVVKIRKRKQTQSNRNLRRCAPEFIALIRIPIIGLDQRKNRPQADINGV